MGTETFALSRLIAILATLSLMPGPARAGEPARTVPRPSIVIILADDLGYGDLGCYGQPRFKTPNLDRMAGQGVRLTQFNTPMPFCAQTRAATHDGPLPISMWPEHQSGPGRWPCGRRSCAACGRDYVGPNP